VKPRAWFLNAVLAAPWLVPAAAAQESAPRFELGWRAPAECPEEAAFRALVLRLAGDGARPETELVAKVDIERNEAERFKLTLQTQSDGQSGTRVLEASSCSAVVDAAALTLALILNPEAVVEARAEPASEPRVAPPPPPAPKREPVAPSPGPRVRFVGGAGLGVVVGEMPSVGPDVALGLGLGVGDAWAWLWASYSPEQHASVEDRPDAGGSLWLASALTLGCWDVENSSLVVAPCIGLELSRLQGTGEGITDPQDAAIHWTSPAFGLTVQGDLARRLALRLSALGFVPLERPRLFLEEIGDVHRPAPIAGRVRLSLLVDFL